MRVADCSHNNVDMVYGNPLIPVALLPDDVAYDVARNLHAEVRGLSTSLAYPTYRGAKNETDQTTNTIS